MNKFRKISVIIIVFEIVLIAAVNLFMLRSIEDDETFYKVEASRIIKEIESGTSYDSIDLDKYPAITRVTIFDPDEKVNSDYLVLKDKNAGAIYRIEYQRNSFNKTLFITVNAGLGIVLLFTVFCLIYISNNLIKPFTSFTDLPYQLSRGNLTVPVKENKNRFFGRFLWGMDMLRENLEEQKEEELRLMKENKTLILSISHDIKTPLSSIKLYSKALSTGLYDNDPDKKANAVNGIMHNADEIERYVGEIVKASNDNFLNLRVNVGEAYLSSVLNEISKYYKDKLAVIHTEFSIADYEDCVLHCDKDRLIEVIQNIIENAIKYGDGKRISISVSEEEDCRLIRVNNSGDKISESEIGHIFDSFYRGSNTAGKKGSGLGLYIARTLMRLMDGDIFIDQEGDGVSVVAVVRKA